MARPQTIADRKCPDYQRADKRPATDGEELRPERIEGGVLKQKRTRRQDADHADRQSKAAGDQSLYGRVAAENGHHGDTQHAHHEKLGRAERHQVALDDPVAGQDEEALAVIRRAVKQRLDSIDQYTKANRPELAAKEQSELDMLRNYLPPEVSDSELETAIREIITTTGAQSKKDIGKVMKEATARYKGRADGKKIQEIAARIVADSLKAWGLAP